MFISEVPLPGPLNPITLITDIVGAILRLLGLGGPNIQALVDSINSTYGNLVNIGAFLYNAILEGWTFLRKLLSIILRGIVHVISDILHGHLLKALKELQKLFHDLHDLFKPIIDFIERLRCWFYTYIYPWMHLVQQILSVIRAFLEVFRLLGAKWAAKLDADIQKIQSAITGVIQDIVGTLNTISTTLGLVLDPFGVLRQDFLGRSLWNSLGDLKKTLGYGSTRPIFPDEKLQESQFKGAVYGPQPLVTTGADGSLTYDPALKTVDDSMNAQMKTLGIAP